MIPKGFSDSLNSRLVLENAWIKFSYSITLSNDRAEKLRLAISPFILRRLKTDKTIISDLPEKMVLNEYCYLSKPQAALYQSVLDNLMSDISKLNGINRRGMIFKLITALKQICNHPHQLRAQSVAHKVAHLVGALKIKIDGLAAVFFSAMT